MNKTNSAGLFANWKILIKDTVIKISGVKFYDLVFFQLKSPQGVLCQSSKLEKIRRGQLKAQLKKLGDNQKDFAIIRRHSKRERDR